MLITGLNDNVNMILVFELVMDFVVNFAINEMRFKTDMDMKTIADP